ncbi:MAG: ATP-dependent DNA helicase RecG [Dehalococcoidia bacterium]
MDRTPRRASASPARGQARQPGRASALIRILALESRQGFTDRAVIGGLDRFISAAAGEIPWLSAEPPLQGRSYAALSPVERRRWAASVQARLEGRASAQPAENASRDAPTTLSRGHQAAAGANAPKKAGRQAASRKAPKQPLFLRSTFEELPFITKVTRPKLERMGLRTLHDLLWLFPHRHIDYSKVTKIGEVELGMETTVVGHVVRSESVQIGPKPGAARTLISDGTGLLSATFFRQSYLVNRFRPGLNLALSGVIGEFNGRAQMENPEHDVLPRSGDTSSLTHAGILVPVYPATEGLQQRTLRTAVRNALDAGLPMIEEHLPTDIRDRHGMPPVDKAVADMHFPADQVVRESARRRLAFDELFINQLGVLRRKMAWRNRGGGIEIPDAMPRLERFIGSLDFNLTDDQQESLSAILADMATGAPMGRLLQGEVGSGKTVVALASMLAVAAEGYQGALMAPTEVLAEQHFLSITRQMGAAESGWGLDTIREVTVPGLGREPVRVGLLIGSLRAGVKSEMHRLIAEGQVDILIGTHALLQETVNIPRLALAVVDEQHRFGVEQRGALTAREPRPHLLAMSATPIPRSLNLTVFGDLDISTLRVLPVGRQPIETRWAKSAKAAERAFDLVRTEVAAGRQAFVVCPLVEESEQVQARAATMEYERLSEGEFAGLNVGLLHGRMTLAEKQEVMDRFRSGETDALVATPVIEVGVDVPNATVMLIESADRFGLAQLHQFRGRVGRGAHKSYCVLLADNPSSDARARLSVVERTSDGFELAEEDLRLRGPGDYLGTRQSGWAELKVATITDVDLLGLARAEATDILAADPGLAAPGHRALAAELKRVTEHRPAEFS